MQKQINVGDIFYKYGEGYITRNHIKGQEKGIIRLLSACNTGLLGNHIHRCDTCNYFGISNNSCRNRHCPHCQQRDKLQWLDKRMQELLPVGYYHLVFTIPHQLNGLCFQNKKVMYTILFKAASQTILELCKDPKHLGANTGIISVLHTWGQNMKEHPHLHCIMPAGGLSFDKQDWVSPTKSNDKFFIYYKVLSRKFRGKFLALLQQAYDDNQLEFKGQMLPVSGKKRFADFLSPLYNMEWVVNIQQPFGNPEKVLEYLSRYVFRIAITNRRILEVKDGKVLFSWKDYRTAGKYRRMRLDIDEFIRRFLLHVLPSGFFKVRYYGIFSNRYRKENLETSKRVLSQANEDYLQESIEDGKIPYIKQDTVWNEILKLIHTFKKPNCPICKKGYLKAHRFMPG
jgi:hypothetical protein